MNRRECIIAGVGAALGGTSRAEGVTSGSAVDWPAIQLLGGATLEPSAWRGQPGVVVFWATYCEFCKRHNAHVDKLYRSSRSQPLQILGVAMDADPQAVRRYMAANDYRFPVALDNGVLRARLTTRRVIPMTCVIDRQGRLLQAIPGEMSEDDVLALSKVPTPAAG